MSVTQLSVEEYKEMLIELFSMYWPRGATVEDMCPTTLFKMSVLYPEPQSEFTTTAIDSIPYDAHHGKVYDYMNLERETYLRKALFPLLTHDKTRAVPAGLHTLLDNELKAYRPAESFEDKPLEAKAIVLAESRATRDIIRIKYPHDYAKNKAKYEFESILFTLRSRSLVQTRLYFDHNTPFQTFLRILHEETKQSQMPTKEELVTIIDPAYGFVPDSYGRTAHRKPMKYLSDSVHKEYLNQEHVIEPSATAKDLIDLSRTRRNFDKQGFTLDEGPWIYRFQIGNQGGDLGYLIDEKSYQGMLDQVKLSKNRIVVVLIHAVEKLRLNKIEEKQKSASLDEIDRRKSMQGLDFWDDNDPEDIGEPYLDFLERKSKREFH